MPTLDIEKNCSFEAVDSLNPKQTVAQCKRDEDNAKTQLSRAWSKFGAGAKRECVELSTIGGEQSYLELQTCLEMSSSNSQGQTTGQAQPKRGAKSGSQH